MGAPSIAGDVIYVVGRNSEAWAIAADDGRLRWRIRFDPMRYQADVTLAVRLDPDNREELDYYLLPWLDLPRQEIRLCNRTSIAFEAFRFEDLGFFYGMAERVGIRRKWG